MFGAALRGKKPPLAEIRWVPTMRKLQPIFAEQQVSFRATFNVAVLMQTCASKQFASKPFPFRTLFSANLALSRQLSTVPRIHVDAPRTAFESRGIGDQMKLSYQRYLYVWRREKTNSTPAVDCDPRPLSFLLFRTPPGDGACRRSFDGISVGGRRSYNKR